MSVTLVEVVVVSGQFSLHGAGGDGMSPASATVDTQRASRAAVRSCFIVGFLRAVNIRKRGIIAY